MPSHPWAMFSIYWKINTLCKKQLYKNTSQLPEAILLWVTFIKVCFVLFCYSIEESSFSFLKVYPKFVIVSTAFQNVNFVVVGYKQLELYKTQNKIEKNVLRLILMLQKFILIIRYSGLPFHSSQSILYKIEGS